MATAACLAPGLLALEGGLNVRDFGGCPTADGGRVMRGMLYRSGTMSRLTDADTAHMRSLGIRSICDLRSVRERMEEPTRWHDEVATRYWGAEYNHRTTSIMDVLTSGAATAQALRDVIITLYRKMAVDHAPSWRAMFAHLAQGDVPMLINCAAGKDRTGMGAALILTALGVSRADVEADYLRTNDCIDWADVEQRAEGTLKDYMTNQPDVIAPFLCADRDYLHAFYDEIDRNHAGMRPYLASLGVDEAVIRGLRARLVQR